MKLSEKQADFLWMVVELLQYVKVALEVDETFIKVTSWTRTIQQQLMLYKSGKSKTMKSKHLLGLAVDFALFKDGKFLIDNPLYNIMGMKWKAMGGVWGGDWSFHDPYHFEYNERKRLEYQKKEAEREALTAASR